MGYPIIHFNEEQRAIWRSWVRRSKADKEANPRLYGAAPLARALGIKIGTCRKRIQMHEDKSPFKHRVSPAKVEKTYTKMRDERAAAGDHTKVTGEEVAAHLQAQNNNIAKYRSKSRILAAVRGKPSLRAPADSPLHGERARLSQDAAYRYHHRR